MNDAQHTAYQAYLRELADLLRLRDWEVELQREYPESKEAWAEVTVCEQRFKVWIRLAWPEFFSETPEERRLYCVHELLHVHCDRADRVLSQLRDQFPEGETLKFAATRHKTEIEFAVDQLGNIIAPFMPLPPSGGIPCGLTSAPTWLASGRRTANTHSTAGPLALSPEPR